MRKTFKQHLNESVVDFTEYHFGNHFRAVKYQLLPEEFKKATLQYIGEQYNVPELGESNTVFKDMVFGAANVPVGEVKALVMKLRIENGDDEFASFDEYHKWYVEHDMPNHGSENRWPCIAANSGYEEPLLDGWHRFHSYVAQGATTIPMMVISPEAWKHCMELE